MPLIFRIATVGAFVMATMFGMYPLLMKLYADDVADNLNRKGARISAPRFNQAHAQKRLASNPA